MNLQNILNEIENVDADVFERIEHVSRRHVFHNFLKKAASGIAPVAFGAILNKAYAVDGVVADVLNFALTLERLESEFFNTGLSLPNFIVGSEGLNTFTQIAKHENDHVKLLQTALGSAAMPKPMFDFTGGGAYPDVFTNYATFIAVAMAFEDTGVRAYKGQAPRLMPYPDILQTALQIHSVEALHAAKLRYLNGYRGWISEAYGKPEAVYSGEDNTTHLGINVTGLGGIDFRHATEAYDEPLTKEQVMAIVAPFIK